MRGVPTLVLVVGLLAVSAGCKDEPKAAYERLVFHARMGNEPAFIEGFTEESRPLVKALLALRRTYGDLVARDSDPYLSLVLEEVESVEIDEVPRTNADGEKIQVNRATLTVTDGKIIRKIELWETDDGWKIDALALQRFWFEDSSAYLSR